MYRILKSMLAQFSYFLEKYFGLDSIVWSILFIAGCCSVFTIVIVKVAEIIMTKIKKDKTLKNNNNNDNKTKNLFSVYIGISVIFSYLMNRLISSAYTWDSKLQRVMSNFQYVMSFKANRKPFLSALDLPDNTINNKGIFHIAMYLNDTQWNKVYSNTGSGQWYFAKVKKAIDEILKIKGCHMSLGVIYQGIAMVIPIVLLIILGIFLIAKKRKLHGVLILISSCLCVFGNFGAAIFMTTVIYLGVLLDKWFDISMSNSKNSLENFRSRYREKDKGTV